MEFLVKIEETSLLKGLLEIWCIAGHCELYIAPTLVEEVPQRAARDNICALGTALFDGCSDHVDGVVTLEILRGRVSGLIRLKSMMMI